MLTHGWTAYDWNMLSGTDSTFSIKHPIEKGIQVKGYFMKKQPVKKLGKLGTFKIIPLKGVDVRFDIAYKDSVISNYDFITGEEGKFLLEIEDFYGKKYASLTPALNFNQVQDKDSIFTSFYRADKAHSRAEGRFGLGLSIVKSITENHGCECGFENKENGVTFWFTVNLTEGQIK